MAVLQVNPPGRASTAEGYISSITIRSAGNDEVLVPDATTGQVTIAAAAISNIVANLPNNIKLITG